MQVLAFLRLPINWPANTNFLLTAMNSAITLDILFNALKEYFFGAYDEAKSAVIDELADLGVDNPDTYFKSLGIFSLILLLLILSSVFYFLLRKCCKNSNFGKKIGDFLQARLFFSVWLRYVTASSLKMTH